VRCPPNRGRNDGEQANRKDVEWEIPACSTFAARRRWNDIVIAEGSVQARKKEGGLLNLRYCDVFVMQAGKISQLISYLMEVKS
jgi:hypothetical protein